MFEEKTVNVRRPIDKGIRIKFHDSNSAAIKSKTFTKAFIIGRQTDCNLVLNENRVSRHHAEIYPTVEGWSIRDLGSANGTLFAGKAISSATAILSETEIQLGQNGPIIWVEPIIEKHPHRASTDDDADIAQKRNLSSHSDKATGDKLKSLPKEEIPQRQDRQTRSPEEIKNYYFGAQENDEMGDHTLFLRKLIKQEQKQHSNRYRIVIVAISLVLLAVIGLTVYQQHRLDKAQTLAVNMFYDMKTLEVQIARFESQRQLAADLAKQVEIARKREQLEAMQQRYRKYLDDLNATRLLQPKHSHDVEIIHRIARIFGESELLAPKDFVEEVKKYIAFWKSTKRLPRAMTRLKQRKLTPIVISALEKQNLPPQFLYLSLQESDFKDNAMGPKTRYGFAKGAWQFIPATASQYGLKLGPLADVRKYDPKDERFNFNKATKAAAHYLKDIYSNEAQASGLLVMASYNWGHNRVRKLIRKMPENPRDRNFWQLIKKYKIPKETYDYVFYIFSAAVIGEDPKYFGFNFENPLKNDSLSTPVGEG